jgi:nitronate monooxygenase
MKQSWPHTEVTRKLGLDLPIVQGPFGGGLSAVELVATVSNAGGLGSFGVHHLGSDGIHAVAAQIRQRTSRPFALNLWIPLGDADDPQLTDEQFAYWVGLMKPWFLELDVALPTRPTRFTPLYAEQVAAVLDASPAVFSFVYGIPDAHTLRACRERGIVTLGAATTPDEALALEQAGVDMVVATGFEAGGHRVSFHKDAEECLTGTMALIPQIVDAVRIPVIAAGGIADGRGIAAALSLGAQAVQIGTAFLACDESGAGEIHRDSLHTGATRHTALTRAFTGRLARGIENRFVREMRPRSFDVAPYPVQAWITAQLKQAAVARGRTELLALWCGQAAPLIRHRKAAELVRSLANEANEILCGR